MDNFVIRKNTKPLSEKKPINVQERIKSKANKDDLSAINLLQAILLSELVVIFFVIYPSN